MCQLTLDDLDSDQLDAVTRLYEYDHTLLIGGMGSGKTVVALSAIEALLSEKILSRVLILSPLKVAETVWASECMEWAHLRDLKVALACGTPEERTAALSGNAPVVCINFDNLAWLVKEGWVDKFDGLVVDESTKLKGGGAGFKKLRRFIKKFTWRVAMTGTLLSENWQQMFYQMMIVDGGETLGTRRDEFLLKYFYPTDYQRRNWVLKPEMDAELSTRVASFTHVIPDYSHTIPPLHISTIPVELDIDSRDAYDDMARNMEAGNIVADTAATQMLKLQQISNGFLYGGKDGTETVQIHNLKIEELSRRKIGKVVVVYYFKEDLDRLRVLYPDAQVLGEKNTSEIINLWNAGELDVLLLHPMSGGHGLNLASGGCRMIWIAPCWSRDLFDQTIARLWRRGQTEPVQVDVLVGTNTVDELIMLRLEGKATIMPLFIKHLEQCAFSAALPAP